MAIEPHRMPIGGARPQQTSSIKLFTCFAKFRVTHFSCLILLERRLVFEGLGLEQQLLIHAPKI